MSRRRGLILGLVLAAGIAGVMKVLTQPAPTPFAVRSAAERSDRAPQFRSHFASSKMNVEAHAGSLIELADGRVRAFWYAGSEEGAQDVEIVSAVYDPARSQWSKEHSVANRDDTQRGLWRYIMKLGNPVPGRAANGTLWLFYVTVSAGGWSGSSITAITSQDEGETWSRPRRLISSPFFNLSTLVKGEPFLFADGTIGLPVYHELQARFGELLRLDGTGAVIDKRRLSYGDYSLQPVVLVKSATDALVLMRHTGDDEPNRVISTATVDSGQHWGTPTKTALLNPNAALSGTVLADGRLLVALNNSERGRAALSLVVSDDGGASWRKAYSLEEQSSTPIARKEESRFVETARRLARASDPTVADGGAYAASAQRTMCNAPGCNFEFSYPYLIRTQSGGFHLVYTWNRALIKHVYFNRAWLDRRLEQSTHDRSH